jgi:hypothetical protein
MHDTFEATPSSSHQIQVGYQGAALFPSHTYVMLTVIVTPTEALFYRNLDMVGKASLPRPLTECSSSSPGVLVGSAGMELGSLRFYTKALTKEEVKELFQYGAQLSDMSTGSEPYRVGEEQSAGTVAGVEELESRLDALQNQISKQRQEMELSLVLQAVQEQRKEQLAQHQNDYASPAMALGSTPSESFANGTHLTKLDESERAYHQLLTGPVRLTQTSDADARYLTQLPSFSGTGMTLTFWYRHR